MPSLQMKQPLSLLPGTLVMFSRYMSLTRCCASTCTYACILMYMYMYLYVYKFVHIYVCTCTCTCTCITLVDMYMYMYMYMLHVCTTLWATTYGCSLATCSVCFCEILHFLLLFLCRQEVHSLSLLICSTREKTVRYVIR